MPEMTMWRLGSVCRLGVVFGMLAAAGTAQAQAWVEYNNETATRISSAASLGASDVEEKDYAWADLDLDGDIDLVSVRKTPWTTAGKRANVLFMNENGVLTDRTTEFASASDVPGDQGFLTPTNDRDVVIADFTGDGWPDIATAVTLSDGDPKHLSHPRIYVNLGEDGGGNWLGFEYQDARIPQIFTIQNPHPVAPRFCSIAAGDVDGDGDIDLFLGDYDSSGVGGGTPENPSDDVNDRLFINNGSGFFSDQSTSRMTSQMLNSAFGTAVAIADMNGDGRVDIVKDTALNVPTEVNISYNEIMSPGITGVFTQFDVVYTLAPYFISVGDLNNDARLDIVVTDDGQDQYLLNTGNDGSMEANFSSFPFRYTASDGDDGFGSNSVIADLNNDGFNDVLIADVDVDIDFGGCSRRLHIYRNQGDLPNVTLREERIGSAVASIPLNMLNGVHDVAVFDINGDNRLDLVIGRCAGTQIWINQPPTGAEILYPAGLPALLTPGQQTTFQVQINPISGSIVPGTEFLNYAVNGGPMQQVALASLGGNLYEAALPGIGCTETVAYFIQADLTIGGTVFDPAGGPPNVHDALAVDGSTITREGFENAPSGWTVSNQNLSSGAWEIADPIGTVTGGNVAAPDDDASNDGDFAFVTENGTIGGAAGAADLDGGPTILTSPAIDLDGTDANISYARWFFSSGQGGGGADFLITEVSNNGVDWVQVHITDGTNDGGTTDTFWETVTFRVSDFVVPTSTVQVRFIAADQPNDSVTEAGIDNFQFEEFICNPPVNCPGDSNGDLTVDVNDLNQVIGNFGTSGAPGIPGDVTGDGFVDINDLNQVIGNFGTAC